jgi:hypothetical protein
MSLKINPILPKQQSTTQSKPKITPKVADKTKQTNQAVKHLAVRFGGDDETKPPKKTVDDFYRDLLKKSTLEPKDANKMFEVEFSVGKSPKKAEVEDYRKAFDTKLLTIAGYKMFDEREIGLARNLMKIEDSWTLKSINLRDAKDGRQDGNLKVGTSKYSLEHAKIVGQAVLQFREYESKLKDTNNAEGENETNRIGKDIYGLHHETFRKMGDSLVNIVPDTINSLFGGKTGEPNRSTPNFGRAKIGEMYDELAKTDAEVKVPRIDTTGIMPPYKFESQMMRRNLNGIVDGEGPKAGETISTGASIVAPLVVGKVSTPTKVNTLKSLGALPEVETSIARKVSTGGLRNETPLTKAQKMEALEYAKKLGIAKEDVVFTENMNTSYKLLFGKERMYIGTDVLPATKKGLKANSRVSMKGAIAHELEGHRVAELAGKTNTSELLEEVQASIRAARFAPDLTSQERVTLIRDALERLQKAGLKIKEVKHKLWITKE